MSIGWILFIIIAILGGLVSSILQSKFKKYSRIPLTNGMTGRDIAQKMLEENGIYDVKITSISGKLTDNYNPTDRTVNLSEGVYESNSVAAAAVAAHECGHAIQHAKGYAPLRLRSSLVPAVSFASNYMSYILLGGIFLLKFSLVPLWFGIGLFAMTTIFSFVTLPVEIDASKRALVWLNSTGITTGKSHAQATDALKWAAYTYVVSALGSLATLIFYIIVAVLGRR